MSEPYYIDLDLLRARHGGTAGVVLDAIRELGHPAVMPTLGELSETIRDEGGGSASDDIADAVRALLLRRGRDATNATNAIKEDDPDELTGRDVYSAWCLAMREIPPWLRDPVDPIHRPSDFAFLTVPEQHAWELLAESIRRDESITDTIARSRDVAASVGSKVDGAIAAAAGPESIERFIARLRAEHPGIHITSSTRSETLTTEAIRERTASALEDALGRDGKDCPPGCTAHATCRTDIGTSGNPPSDEPGTGTPSIDETAR